MSLGQNLQFLRKMHNGMSQEELAEKLGVSRQTISKWELGAVYPEMEKAILLCQYFSCSMDALLKEDMNSQREAYSNIRLEEIASFRYIRYAVVSREPEGDAISHIKSLAERAGILQPDMIGWDFPVVSQEQINLYHMHGYTAAWVLPDGFEFSENFGCDADIVVQKKQKYAAITIKEPFLSPFALIPNAYKTLMSYMQVNGIQQDRSKESIPCFEKEYSRDHTQYMDVYIAAED